MEIIDLSIGTPNIPPADHIIEALERAVRDRSKYVYAIKDTVAFEEAIASWYQRRYSVTLDPRTELCSLLGEQDGLGHLALTLVNPGDVVLVPDPAYPIFRAGAELAGARIVSMPQLRENGYIIDLKAIDEEVAEAAKLMIVSYPNNPTTAIAPPEFYEELIAFAKRYGIAVLHDNAYSELAFDGNRCGSFLAYEGARDVGIEFNSLSKTYGMAGARIGFALGNSEIIEKLKCLKSNIDYGIFLPLQEAAIAAITGDQTCVKNTCDAYRARRDVLHAELSRIGWAFDKPAGTMFAWAKLPGKWADSWEFVLKLMEQTGVIVTPGAAFGPAGEGHVRIALVQDEENILKAASLIEKSGVLFE